MGTMYTQCLLTFLLHFILTSSVDDYNLGNKEIETKKKFLFANIALNLLSILRH